MGDRSRSFAFPGREGQEGTNQEKPRAEGGVFIGDEGLVGGSRLFAFEIWAVLEQIRNVSGPIRFG